jgi:MinD-like ATPase involved in chromosome partitioning or flagellar assembly
VCAAGGESWEESLLRLAQNHPRQLSLSRRCLDAAEVLAAAEAGMAEVVVLSAAVQRLDRETVSRLAHLGVAILGVRSHPGADLLWDAVGVETSVAAEATEQEWLASISACRAVPSSDAARVGWAGASDAVPADSDPGLPAGYPFAARGGEVVAVWGPAGAPGRTTVAVNLATVLAAQGHRTLLVDADTYGASVAAMLGITDGTPGLSVACLAASRGRLAAQGLARHCRALGPRLSVLTGITRPDRWREIRSDAVAQVLDAAAAMADVIVIDCGFSLERDEEHVYDTMSPRRNAATLVALQAASRVVAVGLADPIGVPRLVAGLADLHEVLREAAESGPEATGPDATGPDATGPAPVHLVANRARTTVLGAAPQRRVRAALAGLADVTSLHVVPEDQRSSDRALRSGRAVVEVSPRSALAAAIAEVAVPVVGPPPARPGRLRRRSRAAVVG